MTKIVVKIGTSIISSNDNIDENKIKNIASFIALLREKYEVIVVTSGAVIAGYQILPLERDIKGKQALASIGQPELIAIYKKHFAPLGIQIAQLLLTASSFDSRKQTKNAKTNVQTLLNNGVLPIINENDATVIKELIFGDNDQLSASVCHFFDCEMLVILSDIDGYYNKNPHEHSDAKMHKTVQNITDKELDTAPSPNHKFATGGILTKLKAARFLLRNNRKMLLASGVNLSDAKSFLLNENHKKGTLFTKVQFT